jgi:hypothetical protein
LPERLPPARSGRPSAPGPAGTAARLRARRTHAQLLSGGASTPVDAVRRLLAVQAQDPRAAGLALRARCAGLTRADVDRAITPDRALVCGWLGRGTLHLVARDDYAWLLGLCAPTRFAASRRRLAQEGVSPQQADRACELVAASLADAGPLPREELIGRLAAAGLPTAGQAAIHLLMLSALRGITLVCPCLGDPGAATFALTDDWLGRRPTPLDGAGRDAALTELARRYLAGHGPASPADLARWAGLPVRDARRGLAAIAGELVAYSGELVDLVRPGPEPVGGLPPRLLPAFDPYLLGWKDRGFAVAPADRQRVHPGGGVVRAVATSDGRAAGTWTALRRNGQISVMVEPFAATGGALADALGAEARDIARYEGLVLGRVDIAAPSAA